MHGSYKSHIMPADIVQNAIFFALSSPQGMLLAKCLQGESLAMSRDGWPPSHVDPMITLRTVVGDVFFDYGVYQSYSVGGYNNGVMYVKEDRLEYECICCGRLCCVCCRCCGACCGKSFDLDAIASVEVLENQWFSI